MPEETVYTYTSYRPSPTRMMADETPEHKFAYLKRRDMFRKGAKAISYKPRCICGWKGELFMSQKHAHAVWSSRHMAEVLKQQTLPLYGKERERNA